MKQQTPTNSFQQTHQHHSNQRIAQSCWNSLCQENVDCSAGLECHFPFWDTGFVRPIWKVSVFVLSLSPRTHVISLHPLSPLISLHPLISLPLSTPSSPRFFPSVPPSNPASSVLFVAVGSHFYVGLVSNTYSQPHCLVVSNLVSAHIKQNANGYCLEHPPNQLKTSTHTQTSAPTHTKKKTSTTNINEHKITNGKTFAFAPSTALAAAAAVAPAAAAAVE